MEVIAEPDQAWMPIRGNKWVTVGDPDPDPSEGPNSNIIHHVQFRSLPM